MHAKSSAVKTFSYLPFCVATLFYIYALIIQTIPSLLLSKWLIIIDSDYASANLLVGVFFYVYAPAHLLAGWLYDRFSMKHILLIGTLLCAVSASLCGIAESFLLALLSRVILGIGAAFASIGLLVIISDHFPKNYFATLASSLLVVYAMNALLPFYAPHLAITITNWKLFFLLLSVSGVGIAFLVNSFITDNQPRNKMSLLEHFRYVVSRNENWIAIIYSFSIWMPLTIFSGLWGIPYLEARYSLPRETAFIGIAMIWLGVIFGSPIISYVSDFLGRRRLLLIICALLGLFAILIILYNQKLSLLGMYILLSLLGVAASGQNLAFSVINDQTPRTILGSSFGLNSLAVLVGGALFQPLIGLLLNWHWSGQFQHNLPVYSAFIYQRALIVLIPCYGIALFVSALLLSEPRPQQTSA